MSWEPDIEELRRRMELARRMGGPDNVERQHKAGRLTVRERVERLLDPDSFHETGAVAGVPVYENGRLASIRPANFVMGTGRINGRRVVVGGDDFTVRGGANDASDNPGFLIGVAAERAGTIRKGVRALAAVYQATVPWVTVIVRRVFGVAGAGHANVQALNLRYAWPSGDWGSLPLEGGIEAAYRRQDPPATCDYRS